jgi:hypothetical protein
VAPERDLSKKIAPLDWPFEPSVPGWARQRGNLADSKGRREDKRAAAGRRLAAALIFGRQVSGRV